MFSVECQAEKRNFDIDISLMYEFKSRTQADRTQDAQAEKKETGKKEKQNTRE